MRSNRASHQITPPRLTLHVLTQVAAVDGIGRLHSVRELVAVERTITGRTGFDPAIPYLDNLGLI